jgi:hypothetical protein
MNGFDFHVEGIYEMGRGGGGNSNGTIEPSSTLNTLRDTMLGQIKY